jgi:hypothetical protein
LKANSTLGGKLNSQLINEQERTLDLVIDGGLTGIKQMLIDENGDKKNLDKSDIIVLKFFARFWLPASSSTGYVFVQKYGGLGIKPLFDSLLKDLLKKNEPFPKGNLLRRDATYIRN